MLKTTDNFNENEIQPVDLCLQAELDIQDILGHILEIEKTGFSDCYSRNTLQEAYYNDNYDIFIIWNIAFFRKLSKRKNNTNYRKK